MSWARALCHALATMWNGGLLFFLSCEIIRTGDIQIEVTQARALPTVRERDRGAVIKPRVTLGLGTHG